jgi:hypothetical protein
LRTDGDRFEGEFTVVKGSSQASGRVTCRRYTGTNGTALTGVWLEDGKRYLWFAEFPPETSKPPSPGSPKSLMPIPPFNQIKAPALEFFADGKEHLVKEVFDALAPQFNLTESEKNELLPSGRQRRWHNRANWACYDLFRAGLLKQIRKGVYQITDEGKSLASQKPAMIDRDFLMQFEPFQKFMAGKKTRGSPRGKRAMMRRCQFRRKLLLRKESKMRLPNCEKPWWLIF